MKMINPTQVSKGANVCALIPYGQVSFDSYNSAMEMIALGMPYLTLSGNNTPHTRNLLLDQFLKTPYDYALWIDSDQEFAPRNIQDLLDIPYPIVTGRTMDRSGMHNILSFRRSDNADTTTYNPILPHSTGLMPIDACGFGFIKVHRSVHERVRRSLGFHQFRDIYLEDGRRLGHDLNWGDTVRKLGYPIYLANYVKVGHSFVTIREEDMTNFTKKHANIIPGIPYTHPENNISLREKENGQRH